MLKNYLRVALRHLAKNKGYTFINIAGLATGLAIALIIGLWIADEVNHNKSFTNHDRIAQGMIIQYTSEGIDNSDVIAPPMARAFREQFKDLFSKTTLVADGDNHLFGVGDKNLMAASFYVQPEFPEIFTYKMLRGTSKVLSDPSSALIAQSLAKALFGNEDPIGKPLRFENNQNFTIGGVYEDQPRSTDFHDQTVLLPWTAKNNQWRVNSTDWDNHFSYLFVELAKGVTAEQASVRVRNLPVPHIKAWKEEAMVYPLDRAYLYNDFANGKPTSNGRIQFVWLFGSIGIFVLLLACINFMNLSTARSERRAKEVGIRKTVGSMRRSLILQFLIESTLLAALSFVGAMLLAEMALPAFNFIAGKEMSTPWTSASFWIASIGFTIITGLLAGSYPAFYLSGFNPVKVLKGTFKAGRFASLPRQALVVLQFSVSLTLIIATLIVYRQLQYAQDRPIGYKKEGLVTVNINTPELGKNYEALRTELLQKRLVENVAASSYKVTGFWQNNGMNWRGKRPDQETVWFRDVNVTRDWGATIGWTVLKGRDFSAEYPTDTASMIINQTTEKVLGFANPVGEVVKFGGRKYTIIGVVNDMLTNDPYRPIQPAIFLGDGWHGAITMRLPKGKPVHAALDDLKEVFNRMNPGSPFLYEFMDEDYGRKFEWEVRISHLATIFASLAIFISCLGLFGLASFMAEQRTKEIGVRKVLGASIFTLWGLLSQSFVRLVVVSFFISMPLAYLLMHKWLENYSYHTNLAWWIFALSGAGLLAIALITVSFQSLRAANMSPIKSLRSE